MAGPSPHRSVVLRSAAFRLAGLQAAIFALIVVALFGVTWWSVGAYVEQRVHAIATGGLRKMTQALNAQPSPTAIDARETLDDDQYFGVFDADGRYLQGVIDVLPAGELDLRKQVPGAGTQPHLLHVVTGRLADGRQLVVGHDRVHADALLARLRHAFLMAGLTGVTAALAAGFLTARRYLRRVEQIAAVAAQIDDGRLDTRLAISGSHDEIDRLSAALNATWQRTESLLESMRQLSTDMAHELRTPLAHLHFRLEQARASIDARNPARGAMDRSIADVDHVLSVFGALLRITQIQARQRRAGFEALDLSQLASGVVADYRPLFEDEGRRLQTDIQSGVGAVGDRPLLVQLLANLIENVLRHTPTGTSLTIRLARNARTTQLSVEDTGPGIPPSQHERVLQRFVRLDASRTTPGAGLGLALVKAISDLHEAPLRLEDMRPGLRVTISFPLAA